MRSVKRFTVLSLLSLTLLSGCKPSATPTATAPGYRDSYDQQMEAILAGAKGFYQKIQQDSASGAVILSPMEKQAFNEFGASINIAEPLILAYHNMSPTVTLAQAQAAVNSVSTKQAALPIPGGK